MLNFSVIPGADAHQNDYMPCLAAEFDKAAQIAVAGPVKLAFDLFVVNPENVSGDDVDSGGLHLEDFFLPFGLGNAGEVKLAHDGQPGLAVEGQVHGVEADGLPGRGSGIPPR